MHFRDHGGRVCHVLQHVEQDDGVHGTVADWEFSGIPTEEGQPWELTTGLADLTRIRL
jgi:hypothetical protein